MQQKAGDAVNNAEHVRLGALVFAYIPGWSAVISIPAHQGPAAATAPQKRPL